MSAATCQENPENESHPLQRNRWNPETPPVIVACLPRRRHAPAAYYSQPLPGRRTTVTAIILGLMFALVLLATASSQEPGPTASQSPPAAGAASAAPAPQPDVAAPPAGSSVEEDIRDIRGPVSIPYPWLWAAYAGGALLLLALLCVAWRWYRRSSAERAKEPFEIALDRLEEARKLMKPETAREYSFEVSEIVRGYIELRFRERAARRTTDEFLRELLAHSGSELAAHRGLLEKFLYHCDLAKFARWHLSLPEMESMHGSARNFIEQTKLAPPKPPANNLPASSNGATPHLKTDAQTGASHQFSRR